MFKSIQHQNMSKPFNVSVRHKSEAFDCIWCAISCLFVPFLQCNARYTVVVVREATIIGQEAWNPDLQCGRPIQPVKGESTYSTEICDYVQTRETGKIESNWTLSYAVNDVNDGNDGNDMPRNHHIFLGCFQVRPGTLFPPCCFSADRTSSVRT